MMMLGRFRIGRFVIYWNSFVAPQNRKWEFKHVAYQSGWQWLLALGRLRIGRQKLKEGQ